MYFGKANIIKTVTLIIDYAFWDKAQNILLKEDTHHALKCLFIAIFVWIAPINKTNSIKTIKYIFFTVLYTFCYYQEQKTNFMFYVSSISTRYTLIGWQKFGDGVKWPIREKLMKIGTPHSFLTGQISTIFLSTSDSMFFHLLPNSMDSLQPIRIKDASSSRYNCKEEHGTAALSCEIRDRWVSRTG